MGKCFYSDLTPKEIVVKLLLPSHSNNDDD